MELENTKLALRSALDNFKNGSPVEQSAVRAFEDHFDALANALQSGPANLSAMAIMNGLQRSVASISSAIEKALRYQSELENNAEIQEAEEAAKSSPGASGTFLRRDQCSYGGADEAGQALYKDMLKAVHAIGDILMAMPRGAFAEYKGCPIWVSPLKHTPGADVFMNCHGGELELDGNGTYPVAYFDPLHFAAQTRSLQGWDSGVTFEISVPRP